MIEGPLCSNEGTIVSIEGPLCSNEGTVIVIEGPFTSKEGTPIEIEGPSSSKKGPAIDEGVTPLAGASSQRPCVGPRADQTVTFGLTTGGVRN